MTTRARDFKFAGTPVQRLQLAMVALTQKSFSAQYAWFSRGRSHILTMKISRFTVSQEFACTWVANIVNAWFLYKYNMGDAYGASGKKESRKS